MAPHNQVVVNELVLTKAYAENRSSSERTMTSERDGLRYIEAESFLSWLSQYISWSQSEIPFPNQLADAVSKAKTKTVTSKPQVVDQEFQSLTLALDGCFNKKLKDLPKSLSDRIKREFFPNLWDVLSPEQRRRKTEQWDYQNDPATEQDRKYCWNFFVRLDELKKQITEWEAAETPTASDLAVKEKRLSELRKELDHMELELRQRRGDCYPDRNNVEPSGGVPPVTDPHSPRDKGGRPKEPLAEAVERAYLHFREKGDVSILQPGNIRAFLKELKTLTCDDAQSDGFGKGNIHDYLAERINEVKIPRAGECSVTTQDREDGRKTLHGDTYKQKTISKLLNKLRQRYPLN